jgi:hypothetical protein
MARFGLATASLLSAALILLGYSGDVSGVPEQAVITEAVTSPSRASVQLSDAWLDYGECVRVAAGEVEERRCGEADANGVVWKVASAQDGCDWFYVSVPRSDGWFACVSVDQ